MSREGYRGTKRAENLPVMDLGGKFDPYVIVTLKKAGARMKTRVRNKTLYPVWNQTFDFVIEDALHGLLIFEVFDHDIIGKNCMGRFISTLTKALLEEDFYKLFTLDGTKNGELALHLKWAAQPIETYKPGPDIELCGPCDHTRLRSSEPNTS